MSPTIILNGCIAILEDTSSSAIISAPNDKAAKEA